ncbi:MAG TPA: hypothetical protein VGE77_01650 [Nocardioides sp.]
MPATLLTLGDIARAANVRRPVVSTWRRRAVVGGVVVPFPAPAAVTDGVELFARTEVVAYLERTGRGNNPEFATDVASYARGESADPATLRLLLALRLLTDTDLAGCDVDDLLDHADDVDPDDELLRSEVAALGEVRAVDLAYVDELVASAYGGGDALDRLDAGWSERSAAGRGPSSAVVGLVHGVCAGLAAPEGTTTITGDALALRVVQASEGGLVYRADPGSSRSLRRDARVRELPVSTDRPTMRVVSVLDSDPVAALTAAEAAMLELAPGDLAVILGPAGALCDARVPSAARRLRDDVLRSASHALCLAARLPHGHDGAAPRRALGLWVVVAGSGPDRVALADLSSGPLEAIDVTDLGLDALAAVAGDARRQPRYTRSLARTRLVTGDVVVPPGIHALPLGRSDDGRQAARVDELTLRLGAPLPTYDVVVAAAPGAMSPTERSLDELVTAGDLRLRNGFRIDPTWDLPAGSVRVIDPVRGWRPETFDPLDVVDRIPRAVRTEPGDVVFVTSPRPRAVVDTDGGSLVATPARILRVSPSAAFGPHLLRDLIERQPPTATDWRAWTVPVLPPDVARALESELAALHHLTAELDRRRDLAADLADALIRGAATGTLDLTPALDPAPIPTEGD